MELPLLTIKFGSTDGLLEILMEIFMNDLRKFFLERLILKRQRLTLTAIVDAD